MQISSKSMVAASSPAWWSLAGVLRWMARALLAVAIGTSLIAGNLLMQTAWERGAHVTPAQAAAHFALMAEGDTHHHHAPATSSEERASQTGQTGATVEPGAGGLTLGIGLGQVAIGRQELGLRTSAHAVIPPDASLDGQAVPRVPYPPPRA